MNREELITALRRLTADYVRAQSQLLAEYAEGYVKPLPSCECPEVGIKGRSEVHPGHVYEDPINGRRWCIGDPVYMTNGRYL